jgi:hypothetical protein
LLLGLLLSASVPLFAHGEEVLVFPFSFAVLFVVALAVVAIPWQRWWVRGVTALVLIGSNAALWSAPFLPQTMQQLVAADLWKVLLTLVAVPMASAAVAGALLAGVPRRLMRRRPAAPPS